MSRKQIIGLVGIVVSSCGVYECPSKELEFQNPCKGQTAVMTYKDYGYDAATLKACVREGNVGETGSRVSEVIIYDRVNSCIDERQVGPKAQLTYKKATGIQK